VEIEIVIISSSSTPFTNIATQIKTKTSEESLE
jgi:hypothetical protein